MRDWTPPWEGQCRCGEVGLRITRPPLLTMACHCKTCQRMSASAFSLSAAIPSDGFAVTHGAPIVADLASPHHHHFCPRCMSWLFTRSEVMDGFVNLRATMLDDVSGFAPFIETWTRHKLAWATTSATHAFAEFPASEAYAGLIAEYAAVAGPLAP